MNSTLKRLVRIKEYWCGTVDRHTMVMVHYSMDQIVPPPGVYRCLENGMPP